VGLALRSEGSSPVAQRFNFANKIAMKIGNRGHQSLPVPHIRFLIRIGACSCRKLRDFSKYCQLRMFYVFKIVRFHSVKQLMNPIQ
jgi:hypothetical protein